MIIVVDRPVMPTQVGLTFTRAVLFLPKEGGNMLVLSRRRGERIRIGDNIWVMVVRIGPNTVRLGVEAPGNMNVVRTELESKGKSNGNG